MDQTRSPASANLESVGRKLFGGRVSRAAAGLGARTALRGGAGTAARRPQQRRPQATGRARLYLSPLRHQLQRCPRKNLAQLQPAGRHGEPHRRTQTRPGRRRFLSARVLRHRSRFPGHLAAVQPARRVPARGWPARVPRTRDPAHTSVHLWRHPRAGGTTMGAPPVAELGRVANTKPLAGQNLKLGNPNFAEVGFCRSYLKPQSSSPPIPYPWKGGSLRLNFGIQDNEGVPYSRGKGNGQIVNTILTHPRYTGSVVFNRRSERLRSKRTSNPREQWIVQPNKLPAIVSQERFEAAQRKLNDRVHRRSNERLLKELRDFLDEHGRATELMLAADPKMAYAYTHAKRFGSFARALALVKEELKGGFFDIEHRTRLKLQLQDEFARTLAANNVQSRRRNGVFRSSSHPPVLLDVARCCVL